MRAVVFGAGAIGGVLASRLSSIGTDVGIVARGAHLKAIRENGLVVEGPGEARATARVEASDNVSEMAPADVVLVTLKTHSIYDVAEQIARLRKPEGIVVFLQNGLPWWFCRGLDGKAGEIKVDSLDPGGNLTRLFPPGTIAGGAVYIAASVKEPGVITHTSGVRLEIGAPDDSASGKVASLVDQINQTGIQTTVPPDIRLAMWSKLVQNVAHNAIAVLGEATTFDIWADPDLSELAIRLADETSNVGAALGYEIRMDVEFRRRTATRHKPSTLQDYEAGRLIEYDALFGGVLDVASQVDVPVPTLETVCRLLHHAARKKGCLPQ